MSHSDPSLARMLTACAVRRPPIALACESDQLEKIRRSVQKSEKRIAQIVALIEQMRAHGQNTEQAERLLRNHHQFLKLSLEFLELEAALISLAR